MKRTLIALFIVTLFAATAQAEMRITEWMYGGVMVQSGFIELTNIGSETIDVTGWSVDDENRVPGTVDLSAFSSITAGESLIVAEASVAEFQTEWSLSTVQIIAMNSDILNRNDEINLYDASGFLVDRLTYGDEDFGGTIRTRGVSGNPSSPSVLGTNDVYDWVLASVGDQFGSFASDGGDIGNPGVYNPVPEPASIILILTSLVGLVGLPRRWSQR